jgi:pentatricopeptide repeat protein
MSSPYICQACCRRIGRVRQPNILQWRPRATFVSLSDGPKQKAGHKPRDRLRDIGNIEGKGRHADPIPDKKKRARRPAVQDPGDHLESLFAESIKAPTTLSKLPPQDLPTITPYQNAEILKKKVGDVDSPAIEAWSFFLEHFGPGPWKSDAINRNTSPPYIYMRDGLYSGRALILRIVQARDDDPFSTILPTFTEVMSVYSQLGVLNGTDWTDVLFSLIARLLEFQKSEPRNSSHEDMLISDLVGCWNVVFRQVGQSQRRVTTDETSYDWSHVPSISSKDAIDAYRKRGIQGCFGLLVPNIPFHHLNSVPVVAAATFNLLSQEHIAQKSVVREAAPLISSLGRVIGLLSLDTRPTTTPTGPAAAFVDEFVKSTWPGTRELATRFLSQRAAKTPISSSRGAALTRSSFLHKRLHDALTRQDIHQVDRLWTDIVELPARKEQSIHGEQADKADPKGFFTIRTCNQFILTYMALRRPNRAIDVWNQMLSKGLSPNISTWDCMLTGCKKSRDFKALEGVWARMQDLQVQPDAVCWTTRISGLVECNQFDRAMHALDEMGQIWLAAARRQHGSKKKIDELRDVGDVPDAIKPTTSTVNAAIGGFLKKHREGDAHRILAWAANYGIRPDTITYNTLLRPLIRNGQTEEALALLQKMNDDGLKADVATFTTVLDETFRDAEHSSEEQSKIVANIFTEMEAAGIQANLHTYGKIIYHLLECSSGDLTAVNGVLERMSREGLQPSPYISTMLVEYYFSRDAPDLDAVRFLIDRSRLEPESVDHIFWDRVIEGYSGVGDTTSAMRILGKVHSGSGRVSWTTLQKLLSALAQNQEWDVARTMVRNTRIDTGGPLPDHVHGKKDQHRFWGLAAELELLEE